MKIIITGSTGNLSKPLTAMLVKAGHEVSVLPAMIKEQPISKVLAQRHWLVQLKTLIFN